MSNLTVLIYLFSSTSTIVTNPKTLCTSPCSQQFRPPTCCSTCFRPNVNIAYFQDHTAPPLIPSSMLPTKWTPCLVKYHLTALCIATKWYGRSILEKIKKKSFFHISEVIYQARTFSVFLSIFACLYMNFHVFGHFWTRETKGLMYGGEGR